MTRCKISWIFLIVFSLGMHATSSLFAQSSAYKALLGTLYDRDFPTKTPADLIDLESYQLLDTREYEEYAVSHLPGALHVGFDTFSRKVVEELDPSKPVLVYCTVGARSQKIGKLLAEEGYEVYNLYGGIFHWVNEGNQVFDSLGTTPRVHTYSRMWAVWLTTGEKVY